MKSAEAEIWTGSASFYSLTHSAPFQMYL